MNKVHRMKILLQVSQVEDTLHCVGRHYEVKELKCLLDIMLPDCTFDSVNDIRFHNTLLIIPYVHNVCYIYLYM